MEQMTRRKLWLDGLRAVAMLLVILGHLLPGRSAFFVFTGPVKLPLFFAISGYLFRDDRSAGDFFAGVLRRLLVPWLLAVLALTLARVPARGVAAVPGMLRDAVAEPTLWYIVCCAVAEVVWYGLRRLCPGAAGTVVGAALLSAAGFALARLNALNALMINRALIAQAWLLLGFLFRKNEARLRQLSWLALAVAAAGYVALALVSLAVWPGRHMDVHLNRYYNLPFCMLMIWLGCATLLAAGSKLERAPRTLVYVGQNTLVYYMLHNFVIKAIEWALKRMDLRLDGVPRALALTLLACLACGAAALAINRFLPELAGRRRQKA